jgi:hypothetical protein
MLYSSIDFSNSSLLHLHTSPCFIPSPGLPALQLYSPCFTLFPTLCTTTLTYFTSFSTPCYTALFLRTSVFFPTFCFTADSSLLQSFSHFQLYSLTPPYLTPFPLPATLYSFLPHSFPTPCFRASLLPTSLLPHSLLHSFTPPYFTPSPLTASLLSISLLPPPLHCCTYSYNSFLSPFLPVTCCSGNSALYPGIPPPAPLAHATPVYPSLNEKIQHVPPTRCNRYMFKYIPTTVNKLGQPRTSPPLLSITFIATKQD